MNEEQSNVGSIEGQTQFSTSWHAKMYLTLSEPM